MGEAKKFTNPFPGLRPFETDEYRLFFGREGQSDELIRRLQRSRFLAVVGTSGSGKSSLVRAGLLPALLGGMMAEAGSRWHVCIMRPGNDPFGNLAHELARTDVLAEAGGSLKQVKESVSATATSGLSSAEAEAMIEATLRGGSLGLVEVARNARLSENEKLLVVVDQFEELFRFRAARAATSADDEASAFVKRLLEAAQQREFSLYIVLTMRSDFLGDCAQFQGLPEAINDGQYLIPRMTRDERRMAITGPVGVTRGKMAEPLINRLLNDVGDNPDQLPILQHALMRTWDYWAKYREHGEPIGLTHYQEIGTMERALSIHADEAWHELPDERSRQIAESLFRGLTERGADNREIRRPSKLSEICGAAEADITEVLPVIEVFRREGRSFLMPPAGIPLKPETVIDISHESLIRNWNRLQSWVDEEAQSARVYRRLSEAAVLHREGSEGLLQDPGLQIALDWYEKANPNAAWAGRYHPDFDQSIAYLEQSRAARDVAIAERERQRNADLERERREREQAERFAAEQARAARRLRWLIVGMAVMFLLALATAAFAMRSRIDAVRARDAEAISRSETEKSLKQLQMTQSALEQKTRLAEEKTKLAEEKTKLAEASVAKAKLASDEADVARKSAEREAARANEQKVAADRATLGAKKNLTVAESATGRSDQQNTALASFLRGDYEQAVGDFTLASKYLSLEKKAIEESSSSQSDKDSEQRKLEFRRGLLLSGVGASERRLGRYEAAVGSYTTALDLLTKNNWGTDTGSLNPANRRTWDIFDTKYGLAQAYRDLADESSRKKVDYSSPTLADEKRKRDENNYLTAASIYEESLALYEKLLKHQQWIAQRHDTVSATLEGRFALRLAVGLEELARFYRDRQEYDQANRVYERILKIRESLPDKYAYMASLTETGKFYGKQRKYQEAEAFLTKAIDSVEKDILAKSADDVFAPRLVEAYTELGNVYGDQDGQESKAESSFQLARAVQDLLARAKQGQGLEDPRGALVALELMADAYAGLGKYELADGFYNTTFEYSSGRGPFASRDEPAMVRILHKRAVLNREHRYYQKAEEEHKKVLELVKASPRNLPIGLPEALRDLGSLYANELNRPAEAEPLLKSSLELSLSGTNLLEVNKTLAELVKLYRRQDRTVELENAQKTRADNAGKILSVRREGGTDSLTALKDYTEGAREYLEANRDIAARYQAQKKEDDVLRLYRAMLGDLTKPDSNPGSCCVLLNRLADTSVVDLYAKTLGEYRQVLIVRGMTEEAEKIALYLRDIESQKALARLYQRYQRL